ncbi:MAG: S1 RNA-binding domain-containing protein, partial [Halomonas sp.]|nr:S1 RNA-binding domain-containing protein [Halomonas sp.]
FKAAEFREGVETLKDLEPGMILEGSVTNVTHFGAFVDIGVHQDGLVHISALSESFVEDPRSVVKAGDIVRVKVMSVDLPRSRIGLTMRLGDQPEAPGDEGPAGKSRRAGGEARGRGKAARSQAPKPEQGGQMGALGAALLKAKKGR